MNVVLIFRSKKLGYHSIENVFDTVQHELATKGNVETVYVNRRGFQLSNLLTLRKLVKARPADTIYHVTGDIHYAVFALPRSRSILTIHDCVFVNNRKGLKGWLLKKLYLDWPVKYVRMITAISEKTKNEIIKLTGCHDQRIRVINNPVSSFIYRKGKTFNSKKPVILFIGSLPNKNLNRVIESLNGFACTLHIIGNADEAQQQKMSEFGIHYRLEKNVTNEEMAERYDEADIILFPSLYEGFGLPVIEGFKAGRAVVTSNISPLKELSDGAAWLVDPFSIESIRNTLERVVVDNETRNRRIEAGFEIVKNYSPERVASLYYQAYTDLGVRKLAVVAAMVPYLI